MSINDIIDKEVLAQDEILFLIEEYIHEKKGVYVKAMVNPHPLVIASEIQVMLTMMPTTIAHFKEKQNF